MATTEGMEGERTLEEIVAELAAYLSWQRSEQAKEIIRFLLLELAAEIKRQAIEP